MTRLTLYTTLGCHLCEQAKGIIDNSQFAGAIELEQAEIADSDNLMERYGIRIPVVKVVGGEAELGWPFDLEQFDSWFAANR